MAIPLIGLIVPPREPYLPPDAAEMYGARARFLVEGLGIESMAAADFDLALPGIAAASKKLSDAGACAIALLGTSLSFYRGAAFDACLEGEMRAASQRPAITASNAVVQFLQNRKARRIAIGAAYDETMNQRLKAYLEAAGFEVASLVGLGILKVGEAIAVTENELLQLGSAAMKNAADADALFLSCGAFRAAGVLTTLEQRYRVPVVSSVPAAIAAALNLAEARASP